MSINLLGAHHQHHVAELPVFPQKVDHLQGLPWVLVRDVGHGRGLGDPLWELVGVPQSTAAGDVHSSSVLACAGDPKNGSDGSMIFCKYMLGFYFTSFTTHHAQLCWVVLFYHVS